MEKYKKKILYIGLIAVFSFTACANMGSYIPSAEVTNTFEKFQIDANSNYYISGSDTYPTSILGLNNSYILDTDLWMKIELTPNKLSELVTNMQMRALSIGRPLHGFAILNDKGKQIGVWYSLITGSIVVQIKEDKKVIVFPPKDDEDYRAYEGKLGKGSGGR